MQPHRWPRMTTEIQLEAKLDLKGAERLLGQISAARGGDAVINGAAVEMLGSQAAQVLLVSAQSWRADGKSLEIQEPSSHMSADLELLGLSVERLGSGGAP